LVPNGKKNCTAARPFRLQSRTALFNASCACHVEV
jgi:hypothetical protein